MAVKTLPSLPHWVALIVVSRHIFLELSTGGDLFTYISDQHRLSEGESKYLGFQLMKGLSVALCSTRSSISS
jgi:hypothetical protein